MAKRGKVGCGGREIMAALWGSRGRPETNEWADMCAEQQLRLQNRLVESLRVVKTYVPESSDSFQLVEVIRSPRLAESTRTSEKWAAARARHRNQESE